MDEELQYLRQKKLKEMLGSMKTAEARRGEDHPIQLTDGSFDEVVRSQDLLLVDFWAPWCAPCRMVAPTIEALARDYSGRVAFGKLNTDDNPRVAQRFGIMSIPTLLLFKKGQPVDSIIGAVPRQQIEAMLKRHLRDGDS